VTESIYARLRKNAEANLPEEKARQLLLEQRAEVQNTAVKGEIVKTLRKLFEKMVTGYGRQKV
jgi:hypothetical protein